MLFRSVQRAAKVIVATDSDDTSVLVTLTVRRLTSTAEIVAAVRESQNSEVMRQSGANSVIPTAESAGHLMAISLMSPAVGELMEDLLDSGRGLEVVQRMISPKEQGMAPGDVRHHGEIVLAVIRDGHALRFDQSDIQALQAGDDLVVIRQAPAGA